MQQNRKKKPRKRSQSGERSNNPYSFDLSRPLGAAKRKLVIKQQEDEALKLEDWVELKNKVVRERERDGFPLDGGWAGDKAELKRKMELWNADLMAPSSSADDSATEGDMLVQDTNVAMWKQVTDARTGDTYFWNLESDETVWETPAGVVLEDKLPEFRGITKTIPDPTGLPGSKWLCTQTTSGHAHYGVFFDVEAKEADLFVTGLRTASHFRSDIFEGRYRLLVRDGSGRGHEKSKDGWRQVGYKEVRGEVRTIGPKRWDAFGLPRKIKTSAGGMLKLLPAITSEDTDPEVIYGPIPLAEAIRVPAGQTVGFALWSDESLGIVLRKKDVWMNQGRYRTRRWEGGFFAPGEVTDDNADMSIRAGLVPRKDIFRSVANDEGYTAFVGILQYTLDKALVPEMEPLQAETSDEMKEGSAAGDDVEFNERSEEISSDELLEQGDGDESDLTDPGLMQPEVDAESLAEGPADSFFGGGGGGAAGSAGGAVVLACYLGDSEAGEVDLKRGIDFSALQSQVAKLCGLPAGSFGLAFASPEGTGDKITVKSAEEWASACDDFLFNEEYDLDFLDVDIIPN